MSKIVIETRWRGEAAGIKKEVEEFVDFDSMNGIDVGSGGVPISYKAISIDRLPNHISDLVQLRGDTLNLHWFNDKSLDYVFSSHLLEHFDSKENKIKVIKEWLRVLKPKGLLLLYLPDEQKYRKVTNRLDHKDPYFDIESVRDLVGEFNTKEIYSIEKHKKYSFFIVFRKIAENPR